MVAETCETSVFILFLSISKLFSKLPSLLHHRLVAYSERERRIPTRMAELFGQCVGQKGGRRSSTEQVPCKSAHQQVRVMRLSPIVGDDERCSASWLDPYETLLIKKAPSSVG